MRAEENQQQLLSLVSELHTTSRPLSSVPESTLGQSASNTDTATRVSQGTSLTVQQPRASVASPAQGGLPRRFSMFIMSFEKDLKTSGPYRRAKRETMDFSFRSSVARTHAWSVYSGTNLSQISKLSVLALPIYPKDLVNSEHYRFGDEEEHSQAQTLAAMMAADTTTRSIFHDCVEIEMQLNQLDNFENILTALRQSFPRELDPLELLRTAFRDGLLLLKLFTCIDDLAGREQGNIAPMFSLGERWDTRLCADHLGLGAQDCPSSDDLASEDTTRHLKLVRLLRMSLKRLSDAGKIREVRFNPSIPFITETFLLAERSYLIRLMQLYGCIVETGSVSTVFFGELPNLIEIQRRFLLRAEGMALKPWTEQQWNLVFETWTVAATPCYASIVSGEAETRNLLNVLSNSVSVTKASRAGAQHALTLLSAPADRLARYKVFVQVSQRRGAKCSLASEC